MTTWYHKEPYHDPWDHSEVNRQLPKDTQPGAWRYVKTVLIGLGFLLALNVVVGLLFAALWLIVPVLIIVALARLLHAIGVTARRMR